MVSANNIGYLLQHLAFTLGRQNDQILQDRLGIGFSQFKILMVLQKNPYIQQRDIADALGQTEASVSRQIRIMNEDGLLETKVAPENRRRHLSVPTSKGIRMTESAIEALNDFHSPMFEKLSQREQTQLLETMATMHECICQGGKVGSCGQPFNT